MCILSEYLLEYIESPTNWSLLFLPSYPSPARIPISLKASCSLGKGFLTAYDDDLLAATEYHVSFSSVCQQTVAARVVNYRTELRDTGLAEVVMLPRAFHTTSLIA